MLFIVAGILLLVTSLLLVLNKVPQNQWCGIRLPYSQSTQPWYPLQRQNTRLFMVIGAILLVLGLIIRRYEVSQGWGVTWLIALALAVQAVIVALGIVALRGQK